MIPVLSLLAHLGLSLPCPCVILPDMDAASIYSLARQVGFPPDVAVKMTAIALRESGGNPNAHNPVPPDDSYGLWQINMIGDLGRARLQQFGLQNKEQLYDPLTNARAAYIIWGGNDSVLNGSSGWGIALPGYKEAYQAFLPAAEEAAAQVEGTGANQTEYAGTTPEPGTGMPTFSTTVWSTALDTLSSPLLLFGLLGLAVLLAAKSPRQDYA